MSNGKLLLYPKDPARTPPPLETVAARLGKIGLLGAPLDLSHGTFRAGTRFLQLVTFLGCSPFLRFDPPAEGGDDFCHLALIGPFATPRLQYAANTRPPRCPRCGQRLESWREFADTGAIRCTACDTAHPPHLLEWGKNGGSGRLFIEIRDIFPGEAVPGEELLAELRDLECGEWSYFYLQ